MNIFNYTKVYAGLLIALTSYLTTTLHFNTAIVYYGHESVKLNEFRNLVQSDELEGKFSSLLNSRPIGFYLDTLNNQVYLNNYEVEKQHLNPRDSSDFSKFYSLSIIDTNLPKHQLIKQTTAGNSDNLFRHKIPLTSAKKITLFDIPSGQVENLLDQTKDEQTVKLERQADLNNDGIKEKLIFLFYYENSGDEKILLVKLKVGFARLVNKSWKIYDQVILSSQQLQSGLNNILVFKPAKTKLPIIYIDTESTTLTGLIYRSQLLLTTSDKKTTAPITTIY